MGGVTKIAHDARSLCSPEAEDAVIGLLLQQGLEAWEQIAGLVSAEDFSQPDRAHVFRAIGSLHADRHPVEPVTVAGNLPPPTLAGMGGIDALWDLRFRAAAASEQGSLPSYAKILRERTLLRRLMEAARQIQSECLAFTGERDGAALVAAAEQKILTLAETAHAGRGFVGVKTFLSEAVDEIDKRFKAQSSTTGLPTPFTEINEMTAGLQSDDLVIVAARPSMGKTAFALALAEEAVVQGVSVGFFSLEMSGKQLAMRLLASRGRLSAHNLRIGRIGDGEWPSLTAAVGSLTEKNALFIDETSLISVADIMTRVRRLQRDQIQAQFPPLGLIIIDYLQLLQSSGGWRNTRDPNRAAEMAEITRALKRMTRDLQVPVVALAQLNRAIEQRASKRPLLSDLRESGSIEQDADTVMFLYRDEVYNPDTEDKGIAEIIIGKQRNGPTGSVRVGFQGEYTRFADLHENVYRSSSGDRGPRGGSSDGDHPAYDDVF